METRHRRQSRAAARAWLVVPDTRTTTIFRV